MNNKTKKDHQLWQKNKLSIYQYDTYFMYQLLFTMNNRVSIDSFSLISTIGKGTYGKVILVRKKNGNGKLLALKILKKRFFSQEKEIERVLTERKILAQAQNPFIVKLSYSFQTSTKLYLAMDYCPGGEFFHFLCKRPKLNQEQAKFYAAQVTVALEYLHQNDIVYRDLKPENILIEKDGYIKLADFGLSKFFRNQEFAFDICGTPEYLAPEVILKKGHRAPVDWWALGILVFEMVSGLPPFYVNGNKEKALQKIKDQEPDFTKITYPNLRNFLEELLRKDPEERLGSKSGAEQIKSHPWFDNFDWQSLQKKELPAPFVPNIESEEDVSNFDLEFTECPVNSYGDTFTQGKNIAGFSYNKSSENKGLPNDSGNEGAGTSLTSPPSVNPIPNQNQKE